MLYRYRPPNQSLWNGVGGRIEPGESPLQSCLREVAEETGYRPPTAHFRGILTWRGFETPDAGLYLFTAPAPDVDPQPCAEGILQWHPLEWVLSAPEVVSNLHICGPHIFGDDPPRLFHFEYQAGLIVNHSIERLPKGFSCEQFSRKVY